MTETLAGPGTDAPVGETDRERLNRNFNELLQELRVLQTGVQILFAFMLTLPFAAGFDRLDARQRDVYGVALLLVAASTACLLGPVAAHRLAFRRRLKPAVVVVSHYLMLVGLVLLLLSVVCAVEVAADTAIGGRTAVVITTAVAAIVVVSCVVIPIGMRVGAPRVQSTGARLPSPSPGSHSDQRPTGHESSGG